MARTHGSKRYYQVLLDPNRACLLEQLAAECGMRTTALARELLYEAVERRVGGAAYRLAEAQDHAIKRQSIQNQVRGRTQP